MFFPERASEVRESWEASYASQLDVILDLCPTKQWPEKITRLLPEPMESAWRLGTVPDFAIIDDRREPFLKRLCVKVGNAVARWSFYGTHSHDLRLAARAWGWVPWKTTDGWPWGQ